MGFLARNFSFNGIPCEEFGVRILDINGSGNSASSFANTGSLITDIVPSTGRNFLYGRSYDIPLEFTITFGVDPDPHYVTSEDYFDRYEMDRIANWLTGPEEYKWLEIEQADLDMIRYHCIITELTPIQVSWSPWAFTTRVVCDSPYGYMLPRIKTFSCSDETTIILNNQSTLKKLYYPKITIEQNGSNTISIVNNSYDDFEFKFTNIPVLNLTINIDGELGIITSSDSTYKNLYQYCNLHWLPLIKGKNELTVTGDCNITFTCEFPVNFGG